jgi:hypothetical protein
MHPIKIQLCGIISETCTEVLLKIQVFLDVTHVHRVNIFRRVEEE